MKQRVRLIDIAEKVGVSKMCVSLALRDDPSISRETKETIRAVADELGYKPNRIAKSLLSGRTYTIAAVVGGALHDDYHNQFLKGVVDYAIKKGYTLTIALTEGDLKIEKDILKKYDEMSIEGYLMFHSGNSQNCRLIEKQETPFVLYTKYFENLDYSHVVCDDVYGGEILTKYFLEMGHKKIAYVYDRSLRESSEIINRKRGYEKALQEAGILPDRALEISYKDVCSTEEGTGEENRELLECLKSDDPPTAIFVCNDVTAASLMAQIKLWGYRIPEDVSIAGYEGIYIGALLEPPLTTVSSPIREMGEEACRLLIKKIEGEIPIEKAVKISMKPRLTIRKSVVKRKEEQ